MRIALIDHSYHGVTRSTEFFRKIIEQLGVVHYFYDDTWCGGPNKWRSAFSEADYDIIIVWQVHEVLGLLSGAHDNVVFVPMYDAMRVGHHFFWEEHFSTIKCISFCRKLHQEIKNRKGISAYFRYFPDPSQYETVSDFAQIRPFFWYRRAEIDADLALALFGTTTMTEMLIHNAPDPNQPELKLSRFPDNISTIRLTKWFEDAKDYRAALLRNNVFFAPRALEGIGMGFLEAMASGLCVVAPDAPTMNEYISNGTNGLLYSLDRVSPLDLTRARDIGARGHESVERGFAAWQRSLPDLVDFLVTPHQRWSEKHGQMHYNSLHRQVVTNVPLAAVGKVSIVTVCLNAADSLEETIKSVLDQDQTNIEYVILDGGSQDGTIDVIEKYADRLTYRQSERDEGVYDGMNKAIDKCSGDWILFLNAGDTFSASDSLSRMFRYVPGSADVVYGHHLYVPVGEAAEYHPAADFELTWQRLKRGDLWFDWLAGIPAHQATAVRRQLLAKLRFDRQFQIAADHDLLFRARKSGAKFFNCDELVSIYVGGGMSARNYAQCKREWAQIACRYGDPEAAQNFYLKLDAVEEENGDGEKSKIDLPEATRQFQIGNFLSRLRRHKRNHRPASPDIEVQEG